MIPELGQLALALALAVALVQGTVPLVGAARGNAAWMAVGCRWCLPDRPVVGSVVVLVAGKRNCQPNW